MENLQSVLISILLNVEGLSVAEIIVSKSNNFSK